MIKIGLGRVGPQGTKGGQVVTGIKGMGKHIPASSSSSSSSSTSEASSSPSSSSMSDSSYLASYISIVLHASSRATTLDT
jgi:hypothetical protein